MATRTRATATATRKRLKARGVEDARYRQLVESVTDYGIVLLDLEARVLTWNAGAAALYGYPAAEIVGRPFAQLHTPEDVQRGGPARVVATAAAVGRAEDEGWRVRRDGTRFWANAVLTALRDEREWAIGYGLVIRDLTERRRQEESLERYRQMVEGVQDYAIVLLEPNGKVLTWNAGARAMFGWSAEEMIGASYVRKYTPEDGAAGKPEQELRRAGTEGRVEIEGWRARKDGSRFWVSSVFTALRDEDGKLVGFTLVARDLTDRRREAERKDTLIATLRESTLQMATGLAQILASATQQAAGTQEQAGAVRETVATVDEVLQTSEQATQRARAVADTVARTLEIGKAGRRAVEDSMASMESVKERVEALAEAILSLAEQAQAIGEIIATVNEIAEQTNMLALNAAIEASRAGEHGRGFSVVASEVKALASQSKKATAQVRQILGEIQKATSGAVMATEDGTKGMNAAMKVVSQAGETIRALTEALDAAAQGSAQIVASAGQQALGMAQIHQAMKNIDGVASQSLMATRHTERAAHDISGTAAKLRELLDSYGR